MAHTVWQGPWLDLVALDEHDQPVLAVIVKAMHSAIPVAIEWLEMHESEMRSAGDPIPYWMFVDLDSIIVFSIKDEDHPAKVAFQVPTDVAVSKFEPEFAKKRIFDDYLVALIEAWLGDFTSWRNSAAPVSLKEFAEIGLAERLKGGTIHREVSIADLDPVRRNQLHHEPLPGPRFVD